MSRKPDPSRFGLENYQAPDRFGEWLGYKVTRVSREKHVAEVTLRVREDHLSPAGRVHGGVISAFFDFACGAAVFSTLGPKDFCSTVELKVNYLRPIDLGDELKALARVIFRGKRLCVLHAYLYRNGGREPVAMASATFNVVTANGRKG
jgi:acyl-CoA thioesterase